MKSFKGKRILIWKNRSKSSRWGSLDSRKLFYQSLGKLIPREKTLEALGQSGMDKSFQEGHGNHSGKWKRKNRSRGSKLSFSVCLSKNEKVISFWHHIATIAIWKGKQMFTFSFFLLVFLSLDSVGTRVKGKTGFIYWSCVIKHADICAQPAEPSFPTQWYLAYDTTLGSFKKGFDVFQHKQKGRWNLNSGCAHSQNCRWLNYSC